MSSRASAQTRPPHVVGLIAELAMRRRVFVPIGRVVTIDADAVALGTGTISLRRFERRRGELLVLEDLLDRQVTIAESARRPPWWTWRWRPTVSASGR